MMAHVDFLLGPHDAAAIRFGISAPHEVSRAVAVLQEPSRHPLQWGWLREIAPDVPEEALRTLSTAILPGIYTPHFLAPPPTTPAEPSEQIGAIRRAPLDLVAEDLERVAEHTKGSRRAKAAGLAADPRRARALLAEACEQFWAAVLEPVWPQIHRTLTADLVHRSRQLVYDGAGTVLNSLHERVSWSHGRVRVRTGRYADSLDCRGEGLLLVPSVFTWPHCAVVTDVPYAPTIFYPAHGVTDNWHSRGHEHGRALENLLGAGRARILLALDSPSTTAQAAAAVGVSPPTATHHLTILRDAGLTTRTREGRSVRHRRTPTGDALANGSG